MNSGEGPTVRKLQEEVVELQLRILEIERFIQFVKPGSDKPLRPIGE